MSVNPVNPATNFPFQGASPPHINLQSENSSSDTITLASYLTTLASSKQGLKEALDLSASLDPLLRKDYYRSLADRSLAYGDFVSAIRAQAVLNQQFYNDEVQLNQFGTQVPNLNAARTILNDAIDAYNNSPPGDPDAKANLVEAINSYLSSKPVAAALDYDNTVKLNNDLVAANEAIRIALGMPTPPTATQQGFEAENAALLELQQNIPNPPVSRIEPITAPSIITPISVPTPNEAVAIYSPAIIVAFNNTITTATNLLNLALYLQNSTESDNNPTDITLPAAYIQESPAVFFDGTSGLGPGASISSLLSNSGLSSPFLSIVLSEAIYKDFIYHLKLPASPRLVDQLQLFTVQLLTQTALATALSPNVQEFANKNRDPIQVDINFDITSTLAFANNIRDLVESGVIAENVGRFIATNPDFASLPATEKKDLAASFSAILSTTLVQIALSQFASTLGTPGLIPQFMTHVSILSPYITPSDWLPATAVPGTALINPLSLLFLKANLLATAGSLLSHHLNSPQTTQLVKTGSTLELLNIQVERVNQAVNHVMVTAEKIGSEVDLRAAFTHAFRDQGFTGQILFSLVDTAVGLIKADNALSNLDTPFTPTGLGSLVPLLSRPIPTDSAVSSTLTLSLPSTLSSSIVSDPSHTLNSREAQALVNSVLNNVLAHGSYSNATEFSAAVTQAFRSRSISEPLAKSLGALSETFVSGNSALMTPFSARALSALIPQLPVNISPFAIPNISADKTTLPPPSSLANRQTNVPPVFPSNPVRKELTTILATIVTNTQELTNADAQNLINLALNNVLATSHFLNNATATLTGLLHTFRSLGVNESSAITLSNTTLDFINRSGVIPQLNTNFATAAVLAILSNNAAPPMTTSPATGHGAAKPGELPSATDVDFAIGTARHSSLLPLITEAQTRKEIGTALTKILNAAGNIESYRAFHSQLYLELLAANLSANDSLRLAEQITRLLQPESIDRSAQPLLSPTLKAILSPSEFTEELTNTIVARLIPKLNIIKAGDVAGQIIRSLIGEHSLRSVLNEQVRILNEDNHVEAIRALTKSTARLSIPNLNVPRFALKTDIVEAIKNRLEVNTSSIPESDLRTRDINSEPITFDKNIPYA